MKTIEWYKEQFGGGDEMEIRDGQPVSVPAWLAHYLLDARGLRSKKRRIIKKVLRQEVEALMTRMAAAKRAADLSKESTESDARS
jgi:hypothetical protein